MSRPKSNRPNCWRNWTTNWTSSCRRNCCRRTRNHRWKCRPTRIRRSTSRLTRNRRWTSRPRTNSRSRPRRRRPGAGRRRRHRRRPLWARMPRWLRGRHGQPVPHPFHAIAHRRLRLPGGAAPRRTGPGSARGLVAPSPPCQAISRPSAPACPLPRTAAETAPCPDRIAENGDPVALLAGPQAHPMRDSPQRIARKCHFWRPGELVPATWTGWCGVAGLVAALLLVRGRGGGRRRASICLRNRGGFRPGAWRSSGSGCWLRRGSWRARGGRVVVAA